MVTTRTWTDEELMRLPDDGRKYELVDGELVLGFSCPLSALFT